MGILFPVYAGFFVIYNSPQAEYIFIGGCLIAGVMVGLGAYWITNRTILRVIRRVVKDIKTLSSSGADLTVRIPVLSNDELGTLPTQFNLFLEEIRKLIELTQNNMINIRVVSSHLIENMKDTSHSVSDITNIITHVKQLLNEEKEYVRQNRDAGEKLNHTVLISITHVLELFNQMDSLTHQLLEQSTSIDKISENVNQLSKTMGNDKSKEDNNLGGISFRLDQQMDLTLSQNRESYSQLSEFVKTIEDISNRTGTLAINASIEAAHSGKQGEGFKIIAQDIRKLAYEAEHLSSSIGDSLIKSLKENDQSSQALERIRKSYSDLFMDVEQGISEIENEASEIKNTTNQVRSSYDQVTLILKQIRGSLEDLKHTSKKSREIVDLLEESSKNIDIGMKEISDGSNLIVRMAKRTSRQVEVISLSINDVDQQIMSFNTQSSEDIDSLAESGIAELENLDD